MSKGKVMKDEGVKIFLDRERTFLFDLNALCELENKFDDIAEAFEGLEKRSFNKIRSIVHALLAHEEDESFTEKEAGKLINQHNLEEVAVALAKALGDSVPESDEETTKPEEAGKQ